MSRTANTGGDVHDWLDEADDPSADAPNAASQSDPDETQRGSAEPGTADELSDVGADGAAPVLAEPGRRFVGFVLEVVLVLGTLGIGWLIWSMIEWRDARTPAKRLLRDLVVVDAWSGEQVSWRRMAVRELGAKIGLVGLFGVATFGLGWAIAGALVLSETRATLWDRLAETTVVHPGD